MKLARLLFAYDSLSWTQRMFFYTHYSSVTGILSYFIQSLQERKIMGTVCIWWSIFALLLSVVEILHTGIAYALHWHGGPSDVAALATRVSFHATLATRVSFHAKAASKTDTERRFDINTRRGTVIHVSCPTAINGTVCLNNTIQHEWELCSLA